MVGYTGIYKQTDREGRFRFRIHRAMRPMRALPQPDTFSFYLVAVLAGRPDARPWPIDRTLVRVQVARPGEMPTPASVEIRLPVP